MHSLDSPDFEERDRQAAEIVAREAERAGVAQIIYLGGLGDDAPGLSPHLRSRIETGRRLASGAVPVTVLRAAMVIGPGCAFETIVALVDRLPGMVTPRWVSTPTQPIAWSTWCATWRDCAAWSRRSAPASTRAVPR